MSGGLKEIVDDSSHTNVAGLRRLISGNGQITRAANSAFFIPWIGIAIPEDITWHQVVAHGKSGIESLKNLGHQLYNGASQLAIQFDRYVLGVNYPDMPETNLGILDWMGDAARKTRKPFEYALKSISNLPGKIKKARNEMVSALREAGYSYTIDLSQIGDGALPEKVWGIMHIFALTRPTLQNGGRIRDNYIDEIHRLNRIFESMESPRPGILSKYLLVYVVGSPVAQLDPKAATATMLNGYNNPIFREELGFAGYKFMDNPK